MGLFKGIAIFIAWLTSSMAGIAAIFYAFGYLVARAQLNLLGLFGLFEYPGELYLQEGAKFFVTIAVLIMGNILPWMTLLFYAVVLLSLLAAPPLILLRLWKRSLAVEHLERAHAAGISLWQKHPQLWRMLLLAGLFVVLMFHVLPYLLRFADVLSISNVLFGPSSVTLGPGHAEKVYDWLMHGESQELQQYFMTLLGGEFLALFLLIAAWQVSQSLPARFWFVSPFIVIFSLYTVFTPMVYGVLVRPARYAVVTLDWKESHGPSTASKLFLLKKSSQELILWDSHEKEVLCLSRDLVDGVRVLGMESLFSQRQKNPDQEGNMHFRLNVFFHMIGGILLCLAGWACVPIHDGTLWDGDRGRYIGKLETSGPNVFVDARRARYGESIYEGMTVSTGEGSSARIVYPDGGFSQLDANTDPWFGIRVDGATGRECVYIRIDIGQVFIDRNLHCFETPDMAAILNSRANVRVEDGETELVVFEGSARSQRPPGVIVMPREGAVFSRSDVVDGPRFWSPQELRVRSTWPYLYDFSPPRLSPPARDRIEDARPIFPSRDVGTPQRRWEETLREEPIPARRPRLQPERRPEVEEVIPVRPQQEIIIE